MMGSIKVSRPILLCVCLVAVQVFAQRPAHYTHHESDLLNAMELFDKGHYGAAQYEFEEVANAISDDHSNTKVEAEYFAALCAVKLFNDDAGARMTDFVLMHPESPRTVTVRKELFFYHFVQRLLVPFCCFVPLEVVAH